MTCKELGLSYRVKFSKLNCHPGYPVGTGGETSIQITRTTSHVSVVARHDGNIPWKEGMV